MYTYTLREKLDRWRKHYEAIEWLRLKRVGSQSLILICLPINLQCNGEWRNVSLGRWGNYIEWEGGFEMGIRAKISEGMNYGNDREGGSRRQQSNVEAKERKQIENVSVTDTHMLWPVAMRWVVDYIGGRKGCALVRLCYVAASPPYFLCKCSLSLAIYFTTKLTPPTPTHTTPSE